MTWDQIDEALEHYPPSFENLDKRAEIFSAIDQHVADRYTQKDQQLVSMYRRRIDRALERMERSTVEQGVRLWKFYSSSVVLQDSRGFVAVDFCQGPAAGDEVPERGPAADLEFYWRPEQRERLADLVDVSLITHANRDHYDVALSELLGQRGKPVVVTERLKRNWDSRGSILTTLVPTYDTVQRIGPYETLVHCGVQFGGPYEPGTWRRPYQRNKAQDGTSNVYLIRMGGMVFFQAAENYEELDEWLDVWARKGWRVDVLFQTGMGRSIDSVRRMYPNTFRFRVHDLEMTHPSGGSKISLHDHDRELYCQRRKMYCAWGESFDITEDLIAPLREPIPYEERLVRWPATTPHWVLVALDELRLSDLVPTASEWASDVLEKLCVERLGPEGVAAVKGRLRRFAEEHGRDVGSQ